MTDVQEALRATGRQGIERIHGVDLAWSMAGRGPLAVWCHGLGSSSRGQERAGLFDWSALESTRTLLRYDARGHGDSTGRPVAADYRWERLADDLLALLDRLAPGESVAGIGSSMGSATLVLAALRDPARFERLALTAPSTLHVTRPAQRGRYLDLVAFREEHGEEAFLRHRLSFPSPAIFREGVDRLAWEVPADLTTAVLRGAAESDYPPMDRLAEVRQPTLVLAWASDAAHPLSAAGTLADAMPAASLEIANTVADVARWPARTGAFLSAPQRLISTKETR